MSTLDLNPSKVESTSDGSAPHSKVSRDLPPTPPASVIASPEVMEKKHSPSSSRQASPSKSELYESKHTGPFLTQVKEGEVNKKSGGKSQLDPRSSSFQPFAASQHGTPDLSKLSLKGDQVYKEAALVTQGPTTPRKKKDVWAFETPRRATRDRDNSSPTPGMSHSPTTPATGKNTQPVTPYTPANKAARTPLVGGHEKEAVKINPSFSGAQETVEEVGRYLLAIADFRAIIVKTLKSTGCVIVVFYDPREALKVYRTLQTSSVSLAGQGPLLQLHCMKVDKNLVRSILGAKDGWEQICSKAEPTVKVQIIGGIGVSRTVMEGCLTTIGELQRLDPVGHEGRIFIAEFFDTRDAAQAIALLNGQRAGDALLQVSYLYSEMSRSVSAPSSTGYTLGSAAYTPGSFGRGSIPGRSRPDSSVSLDLFGYPPSAATSQSSHLNTPSTSSFGRARSELDVFSSRPTSSLYSASRQSALSSSRHSTPRSWDQASVTGSQTGYETPDRLLALSRWIYEPGTIQGLVNSADIDARARQHQGFGGHWNMNDRKAIPAHNRVFPERILSGLDSRTTVMIKDVPNKLYRHELVDILAETVPGEFDFVYLRFDFKNCCNALYQFIQARVGKKWNMFSSEKVLQVSYADIQGKAALINKFRNSAVMGVIEPWRPQIFYSSGSMKGMIEPFPDSDNLAVRQKSTVAQLASLGSPSSSSFGYDDNHYYEYPMSQDSSFVL